MERQGGYAVMGASSDASRAECSRYIHVGTSVQATGTLLLAPIQATILPTWEFGRDLLHISLEMFILPPWSTGDYCLGE